METQDQKILRIYDTTALTLSQVGDRCGVTKRRVQYIVEKHRTEEQRAKRNSKDLWDKLPEPTPPLNIDSCANAVYYYRTTLLPLSEIATQPDVYLTHYQVTLLINEMTTKEERLDRRRRQLELQAQNSSFLEPYIPLMVTTSRVNSVPNDRGYHSVPTITTGGQDA